MDTNKMREVFEAWVPREYPNQTMGQFSDGEYHSTTVQYCWLAWQASHEAVVTEIDQLKSENEALESSRAKLAGELSRLRAKHKDWSVDAAMGQQAPTAGIIWCACGDGHAANSYGAGFMDANNDVCANCDSAMGKGEQS